MGILYPFGNVRCLWINLRNSLLFNHDMFCMIHYIDIEMKENKLISNEKTKFRYLNRERVQVMVFEA